MTEKAPQRRTPLLKAMTILNWLAESGRSSWGIREVARGLDMPPSTVFRTVALLEEARVVKGDEDTGVFQFTLDFYRLASRVARNLPLKEAALPHAEALAAETREAVYIGIYDPDRQQFMYVSYVESRHPVHYVMGTYEWLDLSAGAGGVAILSALDAGARERALTGTDLRPITERTITARDELDAEIERVAQQGYVVSVGRRIPGAVGIGSPIVGSEGKVVGVIVLALPELRLPMYDPDELGRLVSAAAAAIGSDLGGLPVMEEATP